MAVTKTAINSSYGTLLTAKLRQWAEENPVEQAAHGNSFVDRVYMTAKHTLNAADRYDVAVSFLESAKGGWYTGYGSTSTVGSDDVTLASYDHVENAEPIKLSRSDMRKSVGAQWSILTHKTKQGRLRQRAALGSALMAYTKTTSATDTVPLVIAEAPTSEGAIGLIDAANNADWANQFKDASDTFANSTGDFDEVSLECQMNGLTDWDWMVTTPTVYLGMKAEARTNQQIDIGTAPAGSRFADTGWTGVTFEGKPVIYDRHLENGRSGGDSAYFINDSTLYLQVDEGSDFSIEGPYALQPGGQHGMLWDSYWGGALICSSRAANGVVFDVTG